VTDFMLQSLDPKRAALLFIEFQREWIAEDGKLHSLLDMQHLPNMMNASQTLIKTARELGLRIVHIGFKFSEGYLELGPARMGLEPVMHFQVSAQDRSK